MFQELLITLTGNKSLYIENYKNIIDYKEDRILIQGRKETLIISGNEFRIEYFTSESMRIRGNILGIEFSESLKQLTGGER